MMYYKWFPLAVVGVGVVLGRRQVGLRVLPLPSQRLLLHRRSWQAGQKGMCNPLHCSSITVGLVLTSVSFFM